MGLQSFEQFYFHLDISGLYWKWILEQSWKERKKIWVDWIFANLSSLTPCLTNFRTRLWTSPYYDIATNWYTHKFIRKALDKITRSIQLLLEMLLWDLTASLLVIFVMKLNRIYCLRKKRHEWNSEPLLISHLYYYGSWNSINYLHNFRKSHSQFWMTNR